ncbi:hypothetical protein R3P38DRAFT_3128146 [Favolaschia claudopus]|uniref:Secreted protein n=1 Tax=Favolaschia claudopus TaxID=2862362 RepID=A0AAV9Z9S2_9AGAR
MEKLFQPPRRLLFWLLSTVDLSTDADHRFRCCIENEEYSESTSRNNTKEFLRFPILLIFTGVPSRPFDLQNSSNISVTYMGSSVAWREVATSSTLLEAKSCPPRRRVRRSATTSACFPASSSNARRALISQ